MEDDPLAELARQLRATPPKGLGRLSSEQLHDLAAAMRDARHRQAQELEAAGDQAMRRIPRLLRVAIRKVLG